MSSDFFLSFGWRLDLKFVFVWLDVPSLNLKIKLLENNCGCTANKITQNTKSTINPKTEGELFESNQFHTDMENWWEIKQDPSFVTSEEYEHIKK